MILSAFRMEDNWWAMTIVARPLTRFCSDCGFSFSVHRGCRLIENEDRCIVEDSSGNRQPLLLSSGKPSTSFSDFCVVHHGDERQRHPVPILSGYNYQSSYVLQRLSPHGNFSAPKAKFLVVAETLSSGFHSGIPVVMAELLCLPLFLSMTYSFAGIFLLLAKITPQKVMFTTSPSEG